MRLLGKVISSPFYIQTNHIVRQDNRINKICNYSGIDLQIINCTRPEGKIRVRRT